MHRRRREIGYDPDAPKFFAQWHTDGDFEVRCYGCQGLMKRSEAYVKRKWGSQERYFCSEGCMTQKRDSMLQVLRERKDDEFLSMLAHEFESARKDEESLFYLEDDFMDLWTGELREHLLLQEPPEPPT